MTQLQSCLLRYKQEKGKPVLLHLLGVVPCASTNGLRLVGRGEASTIILRVCKQTHDEAWYLFYRKNHLFVASTRNLYSYLRSISVTRRQGIRKITINGSPLAAVARVRGKLLVCSGDVFG